MRMPLVSVYVAENATVRVEVINWTSHLENPQNLHTAMNESV